MRGILTTTFRVLTFRAKHEDLAALGTPHLVFGLCATVLAGVGRFWDKPDAILLQRLGLGSLGYVLVLSSILWLVIKPLGPSRDFGFRNVLTWLSLCAPPAAIYAIPVERLCSVDAARYLNLTFLAVVAAWRIAFLVAYLRRLALLSPLRATVATLLPITGIIFVIAVGSWEREVLAAMGGLEEPRPMTVQRTMDIAVLNLAAVASWVFPVAVVAWLWFAGKEFSRWQEERRQRAAQARAKGFSTTTPS